MLMINYYRPGRRLLHFCSVVCSRHTNTEMELSSLDDLNSFVEILMTSTRDMLGIDSLQMYYLENREQFMVKLPSCK